MFPFIFTAFSHAISAPLSVLFYAFLSGGLIFTQFMNIEQRKKIFYLAPTFTCIYSVAKTAKKKSGNNKAMNAKFYEFLIQMRNFN